MTCFRSLHWNCHQSNILSLDCRPSALVSCHSTVLPSACLRWCMMPAYRKNLVIANQQASTSFDSCCLFRRCSARWSHRSMCTAARMMHEAVAVHTRPTVMQINASKSVPTSESFNCLWCCFSQWFSMFFKCCFPGLISCPVICLPIAIPEKHCWEQMAPVLAIVSSRNLYGNSAAMLIS